jgi:predicted nucleic acid-binding protein
VIIALSDPVLIGAFTLISALAGTFGAYVLSRLAGKQRQQEAILAAKIRADERDEDERRQDELSERQQAQADRLIAAQAKQSDAIIVSNDHIAEATKVNSAEIKAVKEVVEVVHGLVNANLTAAYEATLVAREGQLVAKRVQARLAPEPGDDEAMDNLIAQIEVTRKTIADRLDAQHAAEAAVAANKPDPLP